MFAMITTLVLLVSTAISTTVAVRNQFDNASDEGIPIFGAVIAVLIIIATLGALGFAIYVFCCREREPNVVIMEADRGKSYHD